MTTITLPADLDERFRFVNDTLDGATDALHSGVITREEHSSIFGRLDREARAIAEEAPAPTDCPTWCIDHQTYADILDGGVQSRHQHRVDVLGDFITIDDADEDGLRMWVPTYNDLPLEQARELAAAIISACDAVEGPPMA